MSNKFNKISSLILACLVGVVLWGSAGNTDNNSYGLSVFLFSLGLLAVAVLAVNIKRVGLSWPHLLLPLLYLVGLASIFSVISSSGGRVVFLLAATIVFYFVEIQLGRESHFLQNVYLFSVFAWILGIFAIDFYFALQTAWTVLLVFVVSYLLIAHGFAGFSLPAKRRFSFLIALTCAELAWGLSLWPTHYVVNAVVLFSGFYLLWVFSFSAFFGKLSIKKIYLQLTLVAIVLLAVLTTTAWRPLFS